jgi:hypothetical protein
VGYSTSRGGILIPLVLYLTACGSGASSSPPIPPPVPPAVTVKIGGTVSGLTGSLVLRDNGADDLTVSHDGAFTFPTLLGSGVAYAVSIGTQPANQTCAVTNGTGMTASADITNVSVTCTTPVDPAISSISPDHGPSLTRVTITGSGFGATPADNAVTLNNKECSIVSGTATTLTIEIPPQAGSGNLIVEVPASHKTALSSLFTYELSAVNVITIAGSDFGYQDDVGTNARFAFPVGIAMNVGGTSLFVGDTANHRVRAVDLLTSTVTTFAGSTEGSTDGTGTQALFSSPTALAVDQVFGDLWVVDAVNNNIRKVTPGGVVTTEVSAGAGLSVPSGISISHGVAISDTANNRIVGLSSTFGIEVLAGGSVGDHDGNGSSAQFQFPADVADCPNLDLFVADEFNAEIRRISLNADVTTYAGAPSGLSFQDGPASEARFLHPRGITCDDFGNLYVADTGNNKIRLITPSGMVMTLAGSSIGFADGEGSTAKFSQPQRIALGVRLFGKYPDGNDMRGTVLYVTDMSNHRIRQIDWE